MQMAAEPDLLVETEGAPLLQITKQQMELFEAKQRRRFEDEVIARLRENFGPLLQAHQLDDAKLRLVISRGIERAERYRILSEYDVRRFIEYAFEYGGHFESLPWVAPVLNAEDLAGDEKMDRLDAISAFTLR